MTRFAAADPGAKMMPTQVKPLAKMSPILSVRVSPDRDEPKAITRPPPPPTRPASKSGIRRRGSFHQVGRRYAGVTAPGQPAMGHNAAFALIGPPAGYSHPA